VKEIVLGFVDGLWSRILGVLGGKSGYVMETMFDSYALVRLIIFCFF